MTASDLDITSYVCFVILVILVDNTFYGS